MQKFDSGTKLKVGSHDVEIVSYLAEGGFAHIYTAKYSPIQDGKEISVLKRVVVNSKADLNTLRKEVETMKILAKSKYAVRYYDSNAQKLEDGTYEVLLLMEYCPNKSLLDFMNLHLKSKLSTDQVTKIMYQVTQALASMHKLNLIHRDLKIENILIDADNNFKLADFGSTSAFIPPPKTQEDSQILANDILHNTTPQYRAPEMIDLYRSIPIDYKSDIWALGVFLYKLMFYTTPFETRGDLAILHGQFDFPPNSPKYPSKLRNLVIIMLQVNPALRPNTYQVLHEICNLIKKSVPIEDIYGLGPYDFDAYAKYQQHLQIQQQKEFELQQQYLQQKYQEQQKFQGQQIALPQKLNQQPQPQPPAIPQTLPQGQPQSVPQLQTQAIAEVQVQKPQAQTSVKESASQPLKHPEESTMKSEWPHDNVSFDVSSAENNTVPQSHELTRSSNASQIDLGLVDQTQANDGYNSDLEDIENVEERFPEIADLEVEENFPEIDRDRGTSPSSKVDTRSASRASSVKSRYNAETDTSLEPQDAEPENKLKLELSHTEAWINVPATTEETKAKDLPLDGIFHTPGHSSRFASKEDLTTTAVPPSNPVVTQPIAVQKKSTFDALFDFDSVSSNKLDEQAKENVSRNPFPTASKNPFPLPLKSPQSKLSENAQKNLNPEKSGSNPWARYTSHTDNSDSQITFVPPNEKQKSYYPLQNEPTRFASSSQVQYAQTQPFNQVPPKHEVSFNKNAKELKQFKSESLRRSVSTPNKVNSPVIRVTSIGNEISNDVKLIDFGDDVSKPSRPKLNLDLLDLDVSNEDPQIRGDEQETDTDSDGELKVKEMEVPKNRKPSKSSISSSNADSTGGARPSSDLSRLDFKLEELNLDDEAALRDSDDDLDEGSNNRHSRRSLSLRRPSNIKSSRSASRTTRSDKNSSKRKSFLGF